MPKEAQKRKLKNIEHKKLYDFICENLDRFSSLQRTQLFDFKYHSDFSQRIMDTGVFPKSSWVSLAINGKIYQEPKNLTVSEVNDLMRALILNYIVRAKREIARSKSNLTSYLQPTDDEPPIIRKFPSEKGILRKQLEPNDLVMQSDDEPCCSYSNNIKSSVSAIPLKQQPAPETHQPEVVGDEPKRAEFSLWDVKNPQFLTNQSHLLTKIVQEMKTLFYNNNSKIYCRICKTSMAKKLCPKFDHFMLFHSDGICPYCHRPRYNSPCTSGCRLIACAIEDACFYD